MLCKTERGAPILVARFFAAKLCAPGSGADGIRTVVAQRAVHPVWLSLTCCALGPQQKCFESSHNLL